MHSLIDAKEYMGLNTYDVCNKAFDKYAKDGGGLISRRGG
jgi:hypothetical protein